MRHLRLNELMDNPYPYIEVEEDSYEFDTDDGSMYSVYFYVNEVKNKDLWWAIEDDIMDDLWEYVNEDDDAYGELMEEFLSSNRVLDFALINERGSEVYTVVGGKNAFRVLATIYDILKNKLIPNIRPTFFSFSAKEPSRIKLYQHFAKSMHKLGYTYLISVNAHRDLGQSFVFIRDK